MRLILLLPLWLVLAVGEPSLVHSCPMHGAAALHNNAEDAHAAHAPAHSQSQAPPPHSSHSCSCIGACTTPAAAVVPTTASVPVAMVSLREPVAPTTHVQRSHFEARLLLPYANGPPSPLPL